MPLALSGSLTAVQFCYPAELSLALNKIGHFSKVSNLMRNNFIWVSVMMPVLGMTSGNDIKCVCCFCILKINRILTGNMKCASFV